MPGRPEAAELRPLRRSQLRAAARLLGSALADDPFAEWMVRDPRRRVRAVSALERAALADARPFGHVYGAFAGDDLVGATAWLPPGHHRQGTARQLRLLPHAVGAVALIRRRAADLARVAEAERSIHPDTPHWWLVVVGVDRRARGMGVGGAVVEAIVERADADGLPAYLRTTNPVNIGFYERFGFEVRDEVRAGPEAPPMWLMWRENP